MYAVIARRALFSIAALSIALASGCASQTEEEEADEASGAQTIGPAPAAPSAESSSVTLPACVPSSIPETAKIQYMLGHKYIYRIQASALTNEGLKSEGKITVTRTTRGEVVALGTLDAASGDLRFTLDRADLAATTFTLNFGALAKGALSPETKKHLSEIYSVLVMKDGWLGEGIAARCEGGGK